MGSTVPFRVQFNYEATNARLTTDVAVDNPPTQTIGRTNLDIGAVPNLVEGFLDYVAVRLNPTNAVTYVLEVYQDNSGAVNTYELRSDRLFSSADNGINDVAAAADDTPYAWVSINKPFRLRDVGDFHYLTDWSGAPGNTTGYLVLGGRRLSA
jgi:hypothetical protein